MRSVGCCVPSFKGLTGVCKKKVLNYATSLRHYCVFRASLSLTIAFLSRCAVFESSPRNLLFGSQLCRVPLQGSV